MKLTLFEQILKILILTNPFVMFVRFVSGRSEKKVQDPDNFWDGLDLPEKWTGDEQKDLQDYMEQFGVSPKFRSRKITVDDVSCAGAFSGFI